MSWVDFKIEHTQINVHIGIHKLFKVRGELVIVIRNIKKGHILFWDA